eukprot:gene6130-8130_t
MPRNGTGRRRFCQHPLQISDGDCAMETSQHWTRLLRANHRLEGAAIERYHPNRELVKAPSSQVDGRQQCEATHDASEGNVSGEIKVTRAGPPRSFSDHGAVFGAGLASGSERAIPMR